VADLNALYRGEPGLHQRDFTADGFEWIEAHDADRSVIAFLRRPNQGATLLVACNFTPVPRESYVLGVPHAGLWREILNTDADVFGGSGWGNLGGVETQARASHGRAQSLQLTLPPLATVILRHDGHG